MSTTSTICNFSGDHLATYLCATGIWSRSTRTVMLSRARPQYSSGGRMYPGFIFCTVPPCIALTSRRILRSEPPRRDDPYYEISTKDSDRQKVFALYLWLSRSKNFTQELQWWQLRVTYRPTEILILRGVPPQNLTLRPGRQGSYVPVKAILP